MRSSCASIHLFRILDTLGTKNILKITIPTIPKKNGNRGGDNESQPEQLFLTTSRFPQTDPIQVFLILSDTGLKLGAAGGEIFLRYFLKFRVSEITIPTILGTGVELFCRPKSLFLLFLPKSGNNRNPE